MEKNTSVPYNCTRARARNDRRAGLVSVSMDTNCGWGAPPGYYLATRKLLALISSNDPITFLVMGEFRVEDHGPF